MIVAPMSFPKEQHAEIIRRLVAGSEISLCGCWVWRRHGRHGYGSMSIPGKKSSQWCHRVAWAVLVGGIEENLVIDHKCRNRACWRPDHLLKVTHQVNCWNIHRRAAADRQHSLLDLAGNREIFQLCST